MSTNLPYGIPYVGAALLSSAILVSVQISIVAARRKASGIQPPQLYAEQKEVATSVHAFRLNCAQRAHLNTLEYLPILYLATCITACKYPILAASLCEGWIVARSFYTRAYTSATPEKRNLWANISLKFLLGLLAAAAYTVGTAMMTELQVV
ncbi:hypothetical protein DFH05DRAFT_1423071 [Lentinula detonsa]|uniref:Membrane-associated proteins in eicosanoid and glutathione metabolism n=1 Tax=Lentinula detonsa TaxID=2804962 RepID=A0A9W8TWA2_9AGAR|nr:hypothetical protein DFH05DRAFT_1423071 [Lentinula detonsa]